MAIEKTVSEIAEILGVSRQAVNNRVKNLSEEDVDKKKFIKKPFLKMIQLTKKQNNVNF